MYQIVLKRFCSSILNMAFMISESGLILSAVQLTELILQTLSFTIQKHF